jgi:hypothetical protein
MESMRESWTDQRLDDFTAETRRRFEQVDQRFDMVEDQMKEGFGRVDADLRELRTQMASFQRTALQLGVATMVTLAIGFLGVITQL